MRKPHFLLGLREYKISLEREYYIVQFRSCDAGDCFVLMMRSFCSPSKEESRRKRRIKKAERSKNFVNFRPFSNSDSFVRMSRAPSMFFISFAPTLFQIQNERRHCDKKKHGFYLW